MMPHKEVLKEVIDKLLPSSKDKGGLQAIQAKLNTPTGNISAV